MGESVNLWGAAPNRRRAQALRRLCTRNVWAKSEDIYRYDSWDARKWVERKSREKGEQEARIAYGVNTSQSQSQSRKR